MYRIVKRRRGRGRADVLDALAAPLEHLSWLRAWLRQLDVADVALLVRRYPGPLGLCPLPETLAYLLSYPQLADRPGDRRSGGSEQVRQLDLVRQLVRAAAGEDAAPADRPELVRCLALIAAFGVDPKLLDAVLPVVVARDLPRSPPNLATFALPDPTFAAAASVAEGLPPLRVAAPAGAGLEVTLADAPEGTVHVIGAAILAGNGAALAAIARVLQKHFACELARLSATWRGRTLTAEELIAVAGGPSVVAAYLRLVATEAVAVPGATPTARHDGAVERMLEAHLWLGARWPGAELAWCPATIAVLLGDGAAWFARIPARRQRWMLELALPVACHPLLALGQPYPEITAELLRPHVLGMVARRGVAHAAVCASIDQLLYFGLSLRPSPAAGAGAPLDELVRMGALGIADHLLLRGAPLPPLTRGQHFDLGACPDHLCMEWQEILLRHANRQMDAHFIRRVTLDPKKRKARLMAALEAA